jgi:ABC-type Fe3+ transport system substrate-binding protein
MTKLKTTLTTLLTLGLLSSTPIVSAQTDWASSWKEKLNTLWQNTKDKTGELTGTLTLKKPVELGIAYGTEKKDWLEWAVAEFAKTPEGKQIKINLIPMGSVEGADAILKQDDAAKKINVWTPASSIVKDLLVDPWKKAQGNDPIASDAMLALTPMVIVMWQDRYDAFMKKYSEMNFKTIAQALNEPTGWKSINDNAKWGFFTFGHTLPDKSNSGLLTLVLMAYDYQVSRNITVEQVMDKGFLDWLKTAQKYMTVKEESTGKLMDSMIVNGPSKYNAVMVYENLALANLESAKGKWGMDLKIVYPTRSVWNDNPYYILNVPWSTEDHKTAAKLFRAFLLSETAQKVARDKYLLRPASTKIPILDDTSAFTKLKDVMQVDVSSIDPPSADVLKQLLQSWERNK